MPLVYGCSKKARQHNIRVLLGEGKPREQAVAIAYSISREYRRMCKKEKIPPRPRRTKRKKRRKKSVLGWIP